MDIYFKLWLIIQYNLFIVNSNCINFGPNSHFLVLFSLDLLITPDIVDHLHLSCYRQASFGIPPTLLVSPSVSPDLPGNFSQSAQVAILT